MARKHFATPKTQEMGLHSPLKRSHAACQALHSSAELWVTVAVEELCPQSNTAQLVAQCRNSTTTTGKPTHTIK